MKKLSKVILSLIVVGVIAFALIDNKKELDVKNIDSKKLAVFIKQEDGSYKTANQIPSVGYNLNAEKSVCSNGAKPTWNNNTLNLSNLTSNNTNCYLYFDTICKEGDTACQSVLNNKVIKVRDKIDGPLTENTTGSIYAAEDDDGMSYYFAGAVDNNWVKFAGNYWRIIRVNGNGSIRMIYNGPTTAQTGETTQIGTSAFNEQYDDNAYVGYMYGTPGSSTYEETHANINDSTIKKVVDNWYKDNIANNINYSNKIDINSGFCNDRDIAKSEETLWTKDTKLGYGTNATAYRSFSKILNFNDTFKNILTLNFKCTNIEKDLFTISNSDNGNKSLLYPVGLLTIDEMLIAGYFMNLSNYAFYLYNGYAFWTMTPIFASNINDFRAHVMPLIPSGSTLGWATYEKHGVRPVINLRSDATFSGGNGTIDNPFVVEGAE